MANLRPQFISVACRAPAALDPGAPCPACQLLPAAFWLDTRAITLLLPAGVDIFSAGAHNPAPAKERRSPAICPMTLCRRLVEQAMSVAIEVAQHGAASRRAGLMHEVKSTRLTLGSIASFWSALPLRCRVGHRLTTEQRAGPCRYSADGRAA